MFTAGYEVKKYKCNIWSCFYEWNLEQLGWYNKDIRGKGEGDYYYHFFLTAEVFHANYYTEHVSICKFVKTVQCCGEGKILF